VPTAWIVNLAAEAVEVYEGPSRTANGASYASRRDLRAGDLLVLNLGGAAVAVPVELLLR
jgi:hypothetical protein